MKPGALIDYQLRLCGVPFRCKTRIETFEPASYFTDIQLSGPYRRWHHRHEFAAVPGGTEMKDIVDYELPLGPLGVAARWLFVRSALDRIFNYRRAAITDLRSSSLAVRSVLATRLRQISLCLRVSFTI